MKKSVKPCRLMLTSALLFGFSGTAGATTPVTSEEHQAFEKKYSAHCLEREKENAAPGADLAAAAANCDCIASEESKRLTSQEVKKYLKEDEVPISLIMKSTGASYNCGKKQFP
jgi:hypothetical protein